MTVYDLNLPARILVVGPHGFLATHLIGWLRAQGHPHVSAVGRRAETPPTVKNYLSCKLDSLSAGEKLRDFLAAEQPDWIFHLIGSSTRNAVAAVESNVLPAAHLFHAIEQVTPHASVVVVGSAAEYGRPISPFEPILEGQSCSPSNVYGATKLAQTHLALETARRGCCVAVARPFNLVGAGISPAFFPGAVMARGLHALKSGATEIEVGNLKTQRDFIAVEDAISALLLIAQARAAGEVFNISTSIATTMATVLEELLARFPRPLGHRLNPDLIRSGDVPCVIGSAEKLQRRLGWLPRISLVASLRATAEDALRVGG